MFYQKYFKVAELCLSIDQIVFFLILKILFTLKEKSFEKCFAKNPA